MITDQVQEGLVQADTVLLEPFPWENPDDEDNDDDTIEGDDDNDDDDESPEGDDDVATYEDDNRAALLVYPGLVEAAALLDGCKVLLLTPGGWG